MHPLNSASLTQVNAQSCFVPDAVVITMPARKRIASTAAEPESAKLPEFEATGTSDVPEAVAETVDV